MTATARIIADAIKETGGEPLELGIAIDQLEDLERLVNQALEVADIVLLSGGTSKGGRRFILSGSQPIP